MVQKDKAKSRANILKSHFLNFLIILFLLGISMLILFDFSTCLVVVFLGTFFYSFTGFLLSYSMYFAILCMLHSIAATLMSVNIVLINVNFITIGNVILTVFELFIMYYGLKKGI